MRSCTLFVLSPLLLSILGCPDKKDPKTDDSSADTSEDSGIDWPDICNSGTAWSSGEVAFIEATAAWGLDVLNPTGTRISAVDFDGDGWTDLAIRVATETGDDFSTGARTRWLLRNNGAGGFEDVTLESGVVMRRDGDPDLGRPGQVWAFADVDNDSDLDLFTGTTDLTRASDETSEIMLNQGDGTFALGPEASGLRLTGDESTGGAAFVDYDRDGRIDLWAPQADYAQDILYRGDGSGAFSDVTDEAGLTTQRWSGATTYDDLNNALGHTVAWSGLACDLTNDGNAELLASSYGRAPNHLWQGSELGLFMNKSVESGYAFDERVDWTDNESARCYCHLHPEVEVCKGVPEPGFVCETEADNYRGWDPSYDTELWRLGGNSGTTVCGDINNDGWMDLLTTEIVHYDVGESSDPSELLFNDGASTLHFTRPGNEVTGMDRYHRSGWNDGDMTGAIFDFDNDGWPDPFIGSSDYSGTKALLWHNNTDGTVSDVPVDVGINHNRSHGVGIADFDRDGDLDVVLGHSSARCEGDCYDTFNVRFFENVTGQDMGELPNFIQLRLEGAEGTNRSAIGARVQVTANGVTQTQEVGGGHGHYGIQHDLVLHFGLGTSCTAEVSVRWPDASLSTETFTVGGGYRYHVVQGADPEVIAYE